MDDDTPDPVTKEDPPFQKEYDSIAKGAFEAKQPEPRAERTQPVDDTDTAKRAEPVGDTDTIASPQYQDALQHELHAVKHREVDRQQWVKEQLWAHEQKQKILSQPLPEMPSFDEVYGGVQPPPQQRQKHPFGALAAFAAIAIPLAFAFGRKGPAAWGAMSGIAHGIESVKAGREKRAQHAAALWKSQNDLAIRIGDKKMQYYKDIIVNRKMNMDQKMSLIGNMADFFKDRDLADQAEIGDWDKVVTKLHQYDTILSNAKKVREKYEGDIMKYLGSDEERKEYIAELIRRDPEFRKASSSGDNQKIGDAYTKASDKYPYSDFDKEYEARAEKREEQKAYATEKGKQRAKEKTSSNPLGLNLGNETGGSADEDVQLPTDIAP